MTQGALDQSRIVVGKPLPFSIYTADGKLLLAEGHVVQTERLRDLLIRSGKRTETNGSGGGASDLDDAAQGRAARERADREEETASTYISPLERLVKDYSANGEWRHLSLRMARTDAEKGYAVQLMGVHSQSLIVTAPVQPDGSLVPIIAGKPWVCRTFQMTSAFRFTAAVVKVAFEPFPHVYLKLNREVEHQRVRGAPRARTLLKGELQTTQPMPCLITDLSTSGARLAIDAGLALAKGATARLNATLEVLDTEYPIAVDATIVNVLGPSDSRHPECAFYGVKLNQLTERDGLVLHGYVGDHLVSEFHSFWQLLRSVTE